MAIFGNQAVQGVRYPASLITIILLLLSAYFASAQPTVLLANPLNLNSALQPVEQSGDFRRVLVELDIPYQPEERLNSIARQEQRDRIKAAQTRLMLAMSWRMFRTTRVQRFTSIPYLSLTLPTSSIPALQSEARVRSVKEMSFFFPTLDNSTSVIGVPEAQSHGYDGTGQVIAVLDSGTDYDHTHFLGKVVSEACYSSEAIGVFPNFNVHSACPGGVLSSVAPGSGINCTLRGSAWPPAGAFCFHGTHVSGIAVGNDPGGPLDGVASAASLVSMQIFSVIEYTGVGVNPCGGNPACISSTSGNLILALERVLLLKQGGMDIAAVNMSLSGALYNDEALCDSDNAAIKLVIDNLRAEGVATVIATGNNGTRTAIGSPACISTAIAVSATDNLDNIASFSNISPLLELLAPGLSVVSALPEAGTNSTTGAGSGTSMASPHVAGAWAILRQQDPLGSVAEILARLSAASTSVDDGRAAGVETGMPRINVGRSFRMDFGDAPLPYPVLESENGPRHCTSTGLWLGGPAASHDAVIAHDPSAGSDDDDGVSNLLTFDQPGTNFGARIDVSFTNNLSTDAQLVCWADWNQNGSFADPGDRSAPGIFSSDACATGPGSTDDTFTTGNIPMGCSGSAAMIWSALGALPPVTSALMVRCRITSDSNFFSDMSPAPTGIAIDGEVEDHLMLIPPTAATIGSVEVLNASLAEVFDKLHVGETSKKVLLELLSQWLTNPGLAAELAHLDRQQLIHLVSEFLDPDGDGRTALLLWDTLEERGTIGFFAERSEANGHWVRINNTLLPSLRAAPLGAQYILADPTALSGIAYQYRLIEQEANGNKLIHGPWTLLLPRRDLSITQ